MCINNKFTHICIYLREGASRTDGKDSVCVCVCVCVGVFTHVVEHKPDNTVTLWGLASRNGDNMKVSIT